MDPVIISCALSGGAETPDRNPNVPFDPEAIGRSAVESWREGASIVHIHARDDQGCRAWEPELFRRTIDVIRSADCDVVINLTTSEGTDGDDMWERRFAALELGTEIASFDCGTMNFGDDVFYNTPLFLRTLAQRMKDTGIKPELEIFDTGMIFNALRLRDEGLLEEPLFFQFVLGVHGGAPATAKELMHLVESIPAGCPWSACAIGRNQLPINALTIAMGGHARTGLEDNTLFRRGEVASNPRLVERVRKLAELLERPVATPADARSLLSLTGIQSK
jgi:3-keto-5-aminohexanoate cleavage enzyme